MHKVRQFIIFITFFLLYSAINTPLFCQKFSYTNIYNETNPKYIYKSYYNVLEYVVDKKYRDSVFFDGENITVIKGKYRDSFSVIYVRLTGFNTAKLNIHFGKNIKRTIILPIAETLPFPEVVLSQRVYESGTPIDLLIDSITCLPKFFDKYNQTVKFKVIFHLIQFTNKNKITYFSDYKCGKYVSDRYRVNRYNFRGSDQFSIDIIIEDDLGNIYVLPKKLYSSPG